MRSNDVIYLLSTVYEKDEIGNEVVKEEPRLIYANRYEVSMSEHYNISNSQVAGTDDLRNVTSFEIYTQEYNREREYLHEEIRYKILRVSRKGDKTIIVGREVLANVKENKN